MNKKILVPTNKKFGLTFSLIFFVLFIYFFLYSYSNFYIIFALFTSVTLIISLRADHLLKSFNILWFKLGILIGKIINPIRSDNAGRGGYGLNPGPGYMGRIGSGRAQKPAEW